MRNLAASLKSLGFVHRSRNLEFGVLGYIPRMVLEVVMG